MSDREELLTLSDKSSVSLWPASGAWSRLVLGVTSCLSAAESTLGLTPPETRLLSSISPRIGSSGSAGSRGVPGKEALRGDMAPAIFFGSAPTLRTAFTSWPSG